MKRIIIFTIMLLAMVWTGEANAQWNFKVDGLCYKIYNKDKNTVYVTMEKAHIFRYSNETRYIVQLGNYSKFKDKDVIIPDVVTYKKQVYTVVGIWYDAFELSHIKSISIPKSIEWIKDDIHLDVSSINTDADFSKSEGGIFFSKDSITYRVLNKNEVAIYSINHNHPVYSNNP